MTNKNEILGSEKEPEKITEISKEKERTKIEDLTPEQIAQYEAYMETNPESPVPEKKAESGSEILKFEAMVAHYESEQLVEELMGITTMEEALENPSRKLVKDALGPILKKLQYLEKQTDISPGKLADLKLIYKKLSNAVGIINSGKVDHDR